MSLQLLMNRAGGPGRARHANERSVRPRRRRDDQKLIVLWAVCTGLTVA